MPGYVAISGQITGVPSGTSYVGPFSLTVNSSNQYAIYSTTLPASSSYTLSIPTWASGLIINPSTSNVVPLTLKGVAGDTGILIALTEPTLLNFPATPPTNLVITTTGTPTTITQFIFF